VAGVIATELIVVENVRCINHVAPVIVHCQDYANETDVQIGRQEFISQ
jgi:hypothetical protein